MNDLLIILLIFSIVANSVVSFLYYKEKRKKTKSESEQLRMFIKHLMTGSALIRINVIDPENLFLRSPRHGGN